MEQLQISQASASGLTILDPLAVAGIWQKNGILESAVFCNNYQTMKIAVIKI